MGTFRVKTRWWADKWLQGSSDAEKLAWLLVLEKAQAAHQPMKPLTLSDFAEAGIGRHAAEAMVQKACKALAIVDSPSGWFVPDAGGSNNRRSSTETPFKLVMSVLARVNSALGTPPPSKEDVMRHLKKGDPLRQLAEDVGAENAAKAYLKACDTWQGAVTWKAVREHYGRLS